MVDVGLSIAEFWDLTPEELDAMTRRADGRRELAEFMLAQITSEVWNASGRLRRRVKPSVFMPSKQRAKSARPIKSPDAMIQALDRLADRIRGTR